MNLVKTDLIKSQAIKCKQAQKGFKHISHLSSLWSKDIRNHEIHFVYKDPTTNIVMCYSKSPGKVNEMDRGLFIFKLVRYVIGHL